MSEKVALEGQFDGFLRYLGRVLSDQAQDSVINNLVAAGIINDISAIRELYIAGIGEYTSDCHGKDVLEAFPQGGPYFCRAFVI